MTLPNKWDGATVDRLVSEYEGGRTLQALGDEYGVSRERIRQILGRRGVTGKKRCLEDRKRLVARIRELANGGACRLEISRRVKKNASWINRIIRENSIYVRREPRRHVYTDQELISKIREFSRKKGGIPRMLDFQRPSGLPHYATYFNRFETWNKALNVAFGCQREKWEHPKENE